MFLKPVLKLPDIFFIPEWGKINEQRVQGESCIFDFKHPFGNVYYSFIKKRIPDLMEDRIYYDTVTPHGYSGPIVIECHKNRDQLINAFDYAFNEYCIKENIIAEYVMFNPWIKNHLDFEKIYTLRYKHPTYFIDLTVGDIFFEEFNSDVRNKIRKAEKNGVQIEFDTKGETIREFYRIYQFTAEKYNVSDYYQYNIEFLTNLIKTFYNNQMIVNAIFEGKHISSVMFVEYGENLYYYLASNHPGYTSLNANSLILFRAAIEGKKAGKKKLHLGGGATHELLNFKKHFTKRGVCDYYVGQKIRNELIYNSLVELKLRKGSIENTFFFPLYRG